MNWNHCTKRWFVCFFPVLLLNFVLLLEEKTVEDTIVAFEYLQEGYPASGARLFTTCMGGEGETTGRYWNKTVLNKKVLCKKLFNMGTQPALDTVAQFPPLEVFSLDWIKPWATCSDIKLTLNEEVETLDITSNVLYYDPTVFKVSVHYYIKIRSEHKIKDLQIHFNKKFLLTRGTSKPSDSTDNVINRQCPW